MKYNNFSFVHAADLHLGSPFISASRISEDVRNALLESALNAFNKLVEETISRGANFLLIAGDAFDSETHGVRPWVRFRSGCEKLHQNGIQVFLIKGNHDVQTDYASMNLPENVFVYPENKVTTREVIVNGDVVANIYGISYSKPDETENLSKHFPAINPESGVVNIALLHAAIGSSSEHAAYSPCSIGDLIGKGFHYWALGHIHQANIQKERGTLVVYSGNIQGRSFKPSEQGRKGAYYVNVQNGQVGEPEFIVTDSTRFYTLEHDISGIKNLPELLASLFLSLKNLHQENIEVNLLIIRLRFTGSADFSLELSRPDIQESILAELNNNQLSILITSIENNSSTNIIYQNIAERNDFSSELVRLKEQEALKEIFLAEIARDAEYEIKRRKLPSWLLMEFSQEEKISILNEALDYSLALIEKERQR